VASEPLSRGDVVWVRLDPVKGSQQGGRRPALVLSPALINAHSPVVIVAAMTSRKTEKLYPFEALVHPPEGGLAEPSKVLLMQIRSVDKRRLAGVAGRLGAQTLNRVDEALKIATGLTHLE
jgi:mRNA interferase MazF